MASEPKNPRRDAVLKNIPESDPRREQIESWLAQDGAQSCLQRMASELSLKVSQATLYEAVKFWRQQNRFTGYLQRALNQAALEAQAKGGMTAAQMEEAVDRYFIAQAAESEDVDVYQELRYLKIRDQESKGNARIAEAKLARKDAQIAQKDQQFKLDMEKFKAAIRSKVEAGLAEIAEQVKGNQAAEAALAKLQEAIAK